MEFISINDKELDYLLYLLDKAVGQEAKKLNKKEQKKRDAMYAKYEQGGYTFSMSSEMVDAKTPCNKALRNAIAELTKRREEAKAAKERFDAETPTHTFHIQSANLGALILPR